jgi:hypothetical protein
LKKRLFLLPIIALLAPAASFGARTASTQCQVPYDNHDAYANLAQKTQDIKALGGLEGHYAVPKGKKPTTLVVMFHGYGNISNSWVCHLLDAADNHNAVAVAMDYRGTGWTGPAADHRGWFVKEGADDSIKAAQYFLTKYPSIKNVEAFGISMGGNASGLAVAAGAKRPGTNKPLFDYWVNVEGATSMIETYFEAQAVGATGSAFAKNAVADMEKECGGTPAAQPQCFESINVLTRIQDIKASGIKGIIDVQGIDDGLVGHDQSEEFTLAARLMQIPTDYYIALRRNDWQNTASANHEGGTTLSGTALGPVFSGAGQTYPAPLAGHGWEGSNTQIVIATGFAKLWAIVDHSQAPANHQYFVDGDLGTVQVF